MNKLSLIKILLTNGYIEKPPKGNLYLKEYRAGEANMITHSLSATLWEALIRPCTLIEMQGSEWETD